MTFKLIRTSLVLISLVCTAPAFAQNAEAIDKATEVAQIWLSLVDNGQYSQSWDLAATPFQAGVSSSAWDSVIQKTRALFGPMKKRTLAASKYMTTLPGAPDGEYVVLQYQSQFEHKANAVETITPMKDRDGTWKVAGYFIK